MEDNKYLETINELSNTVKELAIEKNKKIHEYKTIIIAFILAIVLITSIFGGCIFYVVHSIYDYDYSVTNTNTNENKNSNENGGDN